MKHSPDATPSLPLPPKQPLTIETPSQDNLLLEDTLAKHSLEKIIEIKLERFFQHLAGYYPHKLHQIMMRKMEKPLIQKTLQQTGGNQVQAAKILGINRLTLAKKIKLYELDLPNISHSLPQSEHNTSSTSHTDSKDQQI